MASNWHSDDCFDEVDIFNSSSNKIIPPDSSSIGTLVDCSNRDQLNRTDSLICRTSRDFSNGAGSGSSVIEEIRDIDVAVKDHRKIVNNYETYTAFIIDTKSSRPEFPTHGCSVQRRYTDFVWLRRRLEDNHATLLLPPLPNKHPLTKFDRFSGSFIDQRKDALDRFLSRLVEHPIISCNPDLRIFLTLDFQEFTRHQNLHPAAGNLFSRLTSSLHLTGPTSSSDSSLDPASSDDFCQIFKEVDRFGSLMKRLERVTNRISGERSACATSTLDLSTALNDWAGVETGPTSQCLTTVSRAFERSGRALRTASAANQTAVVPSLHEYALYSDSVKAVLRRRDALENELSGVRDEVQRCQRALLLDRSGAGSDDLQGSSGGAAAALSGLLRRKETPEEKVARLTQRIETLNSRANSLHDRIACANADLKCEWERWTQLRSRDMAALLHSLTAAQVEMYSESVTAWAEVIRELGQPAPSS